MKMRKYKITNTFFRVTALALVWAMVMPGHVLAGGIYLAKEQDCLSPSLQISIPQIKEIFAGSSRVNFFHKSAQKSRPKVGVLAGTFNPLTISMEEMIEQAKKENNLDEVILVLTEQPVHQKVIGTTLKQREDMLKLRIKDKRHYRIMTSKDSLYLDIGGKIKEEFPEFANADIYFVIGMRSFDRMINWDYKDKDGALEKLFNDFNFIVADRKGENLDKFLAYNPRYKKYSGSVQRMSLDEKHNDISSARVRINVKEGAPINELVPFEIQQYIKENALYRGFAEWVQGRIAVSGAAFREYLINMMTSCKIMDGKGKVIASAKEEIKRRLDYGGKVSVLSIGCGQAIDLNVLKEEFPDEPNIEYVGLDINPDIIDEAKQVAGDIHYIVRDLIEGNFNDLEERFDVVMVVNVLHEVFSYYGRPNRDPKERIDPELGEHYVEKALKNIKKLLKPQGRLLLYDGAELSADERDETVTMRFRNKDTRKKFYQFAREFLPKEIKYKNPFFGLNKSEATLSKQDFLRFVCEYLYVGGPRWDIEREESWQYYSIEQYVNVLSGLGFTVNVDNFTPSRQIKRWNKDIEILTEDVDFPKIVLFLDAILDKEGRQELIDQEEAAFLAPAFKADDYKTRRGTVLVVGGAEEYLGAIHMATAAALRSGSGKVHAGILKRLFAPFEAKSSPEVMPFALPHNTDDSFDVSSADRILDIIAREKISVLALGPGLKVERNPAKKMVFKIIQQAEIPIVLDAGGLNAVVGKTSILRRAQGSIVITPHIGEMARLTGKSIEYIKNNRHDVAREFAAAYNVVVVLKGDETAPTIISDPNGYLYINTVGNRYMSTGGTGDVLTGVIAGLIGQGLSLFEAAALGVYMHSRAGDLAAEDKFSGLIPTDIVGYLPQASKELWYRREDYVRRDQKMSISRDKIKNIFSNYGFGQVREEDKRIPKEGYDTKVLIVETEKAGKKVVRVSDWDRKGTIWEYELLEYLRDCDKSFEIPITCLTSKNTPMYVDGEEIFAVYEHRDGRVVKITELIPQMKKNAAMFLAKLHAYTMDGRFHPIKGERITDTIVEFDGIDRREEKLDRAYRELRNKNPADLNQAEKLFLENYQFFKEQIEVLKRNLKDVYKKLPKCIIHGDFRPENVLYGEKEAYEKIKLVFDLDTAREEARIYDIVRSLFYRLINNDLEFSLEGLKGWVIDYQKAAEKVGYPLSEEEIRVIPEMLRAKLIQQFIWLTRWNTMDRVRDSEEEIRFFKEMVISAKQLDNQAWEKFVQDILSANKWNAKNYFQEWKKVRKISNRVSEKKTPVVLPVIAEQKINREKTANLKIGICAITANPLHNVHLQLMNAARNIELPDGKKLDQIIVLLGNKHVSKTITGMSFEDRVISLKETFEELKTSEGIGLDGLFISNTGLYFEMGEAVRRYYQQAYEQTVNTYFIMGKDSMQVALNTHSKAITEKLLEENHFIVMDRHGERIEDVKEYRQYRRFNDKIHSFPFKLPTEKAEISSTKIRNMISEGRSAGNMVPGIVNSIIIETKVYRKQDDSYVLRLDRLEEMLRIQQVSEQLKYHDFSYEVDKDILIEQAI
ncbi:MAG: NAD(P)H-hydrate dehydratase [Candidatus Omnitrophica bacterium]|nr:NAD(P)H-hydrate dehydratase [Candidatus Omnitrophota bacterium]MBU1924322.1 NAD(P)H-hydrate dehydratase [Candidatus Omnitrophota bacterium]